MSDKTKTFEEWFLRLKSNAPTHKKSKDVEDFKDIFRVGWNAAIESMQEWKIESEYLSKEIIKYENKIESMQEEIDKRDARIKQLEKLSNKWAQRASNLSDMLQENKLNGVKDERFT